GVSGRHEGVVIGLTGSVASGKTTLANQVAAVLAEAHAVETVSTDGFLYPNTILEERGLTLRKGFPETYNAEALGDAIAALSTGTAD
ncbi:MAG TPA: type I pantothenate kinase, partial [Hyphomonas sp.]|nr:type I pantothenate kinase [Hyphomonas sp.]